MAGFCVSLSGLGFVFSSKNAGRRGDGRHFFGSVGGAITRRRAGRSGPGGPERWLADAGQVGGLFALGLAPAAVRVDRRQGGLLAGAVDHRMHQHQVFLGPPVDGGVGTGLGFELGQGGENI